MNVLLDNCTSPVLASTLNGFITHYGHRAFHIKDVPGLPKGRHSSDVEWIQHLRASSERWIFISGDGRVLKNKAEAAALRSAGLIGFILAPAYQKTTINLQAATILTLWPRMVDLVEALQPPAMFEVPFGRKKQLKQLQIR